MKIRDYEVPDYHEDALKYYYLNKDGYLYTRIHNKYYNEYYNGNGFGITVYQHDNSLIFTL